MTIDRSRNGLTIILNYDITGDVSGMSVKRAEKHLRVPFKQVLRTMGHKVLARVSGFREYKSAVNMALRQLVRDNQPNITKMFSLSLDFEFYKAMIRYDKVLGEDGVYPGFLTCETEVRDLRHPVFTLREEDVVPNDYSSNPDQRVLLITGANNGEKTFYSKAVGLAQLLVQIGARVPASHASLEIADGIYNHFVDQDDQVNKDGRYKFELRRMAEILDKSSPRSLVIIDEPCSGTDPVQGEVQSSYFLEALAKSGIRVIFNTHYHALASTNGQVPTIRSIHPDTRLEDGQINYTYKMGDGPAGSSYALELARFMNLGRDELLEKVRRIKEKK